MNSTISVPVSITTEKIWNEKMLECLRSNTKKINRPTRSNWADIPGNFRQCGNFTESNNMKLNGSFFENWVRGLVYILGLSWPYYYGGKIWAWFFSMRCGILLANLTSVNIFFVNSETTWKKLPIIFYSLFLAIVWYYLYNVKFSAPVTPKISVCLKQKKTLKPGEVSPCLPI